MWKTSPGSHSPGKQGVPGTAREAPARFYCSPESEQHVAAEMTAV